jgi:uncharacterized protein
MNDPRVEAVVREQPHPLVFVTISGAHLYGFASANSDYDLRGVHVLPPRALLGLDQPVETIEVEDIRDGLEIDLVTHDARKYFGLVLRKNGYVLEQIFSPLIVHTTPEHEELRAIAAQCITRHHSHHYLGFADTQWRLWTKERPRRIKPLLYVFRVLLTGTYLMQTGRVEANIRTLNAHWRLPYIDDLVARKTGGSEHETLSDDDLTFWGNEYIQLRQGLETAYAQSTLPDTPSGKAALNDLLLRLRLHDPSTDRIRTNE